MWHVKHKPYTFPTITFVMEMNIPVNYADLSSVPSSLMSVGERWFQKKLVSVPYGPVCIMTLILWYIDLSPSAGECHGNSGRKQRGLGLDRRSQRAEPTPASVDLGASPSVSAALPRLRPTAHISTAIWQLFNQSHWTQVRFSSYCIYTQPQASGFLKLSCLYWGWLLNYIGQIQSQVVSLSI